MRYVGLTTNLITDADSAVDTVAAERGLDSQQSNAHLSSDALSPSRNRGCLRQGVARASRRVMLEVEVLRGKVASAVEHERLKKDVTVVGAGACSKGPVDRVRSTGINMWRLAQILW